MHADKVSMSAVADCEWFYVVESSNFHDGISDAESATGGQRAFHVLMCKCVYLTGAFPAGEEIK